jgi:hypothetical protein
MARATASQLPLREKKVKPNAFYELSKFAFTFARIDIRRAIFRYRVS